MKKSSRKERNEDAMDAKKKPRSGIILVATDFNPGYAATHNKAPD